MAMFSSSPGVDSSDFVCWVSISWLVRSGWGRRHRRDRRWRLSRQLSEIHELDSRVEADPAEHGDDAWEMDVLTTIAICLAVSLSMLLVACVACFRVVRKRMRRKRENDTIPVIILPDPFENKTVSRELFKDESSEVESYKALVVVPQKSQIDIHRANEVASVQTKIPRTQSMSCLESLNVPPDFRKVSEHSSHRLNQTVPSHEDLSRLGSCNSTTLHVPTFEDLDRIASHNYSQEAFLRAQSTLDLRKPSSCSMTRSASSIDVSSSSSSLVSHDCETYVMFSLNYNSNKELLTMQLNAIAGVPSKLEGSYITVVTYLFPKETTGIQCKAAAAEETVLLHVTYTFSNVTSEELESCTLRVSVFYYNKKKHVKSHLIGEAFLEVGAVDWSMAQDQHFNLQLQTKRVKRRSTPEKYLAQSLGELFVLLQYQAAANRLKVLIRKAANLPKSDKILGQPVHYVQINLKRDQETLTSQETKPQSGTSPVWNQPFLFDIPSSLVDSITLEFVIMRGKLHTKDGVVGHVVIGPYGPRSGVNHWKDILKSWGLETARWHNVMPVFKYVDVPTRRSSSEWKEIQDDLRLS
ncbi:synaptotagmin-4-like [Gigantopelta aegis]|uniref:synaptotagmin-4-like n=1 Tax=Gigantopelta aegis TaxID=1735272 RepID=UPI001B88AC2C|nr:synaptotagmin-4-like [Gigantopelta aegis]